MSVLVANPHLLHWELCHRDCPQPHPSSGGGCSSLPVHGRGFYTETGRRSWRARGELRAAAAFWHDLSRPTSIDMEPISGVEELDQILLRSKELSELIIIDWMAAWCRKCIYLKPKLEKIAAEYHPRVKFYFVDVNKVPQALVKRGNVSKMPTIQLWKDGEWKDEVIGGHKAWLVLDEVREMIQKYI